MTANKPPRLLALDNRDSFTFMLVDYLRQAGAEIVVKRSDALSVDEAMELGADGVMVSPGPGAPRDAGISVALAERCVETKRPYLGVCLGHQALALACGSDIAHVSPVHGKIATVRHQGGGLFEGLPSPFEATRYHSIAVTEVRPPLIADAWNEEGLCMAMHYAEAPAWGVQFHPESIASAHGLALLQAFVSKCQQGDA